MAGYPRSMEQSERTSAAAVITAASATALAAPA
eukprot:CAMPEP_0177548200 /NCGR_PEP_ID=MMETSP0369-20130122/64319_1 /TAXON_ID=447022 ORGANISM="Scrippsiella hangoei-like, Strain SHHI-4" /NCGR_SAMPLE_ID=MMETSP0369 /ASSEMBLY_ACC=CAM_ASM_000364 /LENGTH=32 /DNA_ID= /DNA_START= /DNA_END= /DNA_ORIENTATION=